MANFGSAGCVASTTKPLFVVFGSALVVCGVDLTMLFSKFWLIFGGLLVHLDVFW